MDQPVNRNRLVAVLIAVAALLGTFVLVGVMAAAINSGPGPSSSTNGDHHTARHQEATHTPAPPKKPTTKVLLDQSGSGIKKTEPFTTNGTWHLKYAYDCTGQLDGQGNFIVSEYSGGDNVPSDLLVNELGHGGTSRTAVYDTGQHHLEVNSECSWHITVTETR